MNTSILEFFQTLHETEHIARGVGDKLIFEWESLTGVQFHILLCLLRDGGTCSSIQGLNMDKVCSAANLTRITNVLEKSGMIERKPDPNDRRKVQIQVTEKWKKAVESVRKKMQKKASTLESLANDIDFKKVTNDLLKIQLLLRNHTHD